jgi:hypothetical protein
MKKFLFAALLLSVLPAIHAQENIAKANGSVRVTSDKPVGNVAGTNGNVQIEDGAQARNIETVNGGITIGRNATVASVQSVNGRINIDEGTRAGPVETVNGSVGLGENVQVVGNVTAVNGGIRLARGASVSGTLETSNGPIAIDHARVGGDVRTKSGNIDIGQQSTVTGGIVVEKLDSEWFGKPRTPRIVIGPGAVVSGPLTFHREVDLYVSDSAKVGPIEGAKARRFSGSEPSKVEN